MKFCEPRERMLNAFDGLFETPLLSPSSFNVDVEETDACYILRADLPGVKEEDLKISAEESVLTIEVSKEEEDRPGDNFHIKERRLVSSKRTFRLPPIGDSVEAFLKNGVLSVKMNKKTACKSRQIEVKAV